MLWLSFGAFACLLRFLCSPASDIVISDLLEHFTATLSFIWEPPAPSESQSNAENHPALLPQRSSARAGSNPLRRCSTSLQRQTTSRASARFLCSRLCTADRARETMVPSCTHLRVTAT